MKRLSLRLPTLATAAAFASILACGGISDPTRSENVATVTGALTGMSVPANTRVALVWRVVSPSGFAVGADVAVIDGKFSMDLDVPSANYFAELDGDDSTDVSKDPSSSSSSGSASAGANDDAPDPGGPAPKPSEAFAFPSKIAPRDAVSGQITQPLTAAFAGFIVYVDTNGNGKLDIAGEYAASTDNVIGGNRELFLAYLKDGGGLAYEKLRDKSGVLPTAGYNLAWKDGRWLPLNVVELTLSASAKLPSTVCSGSSNSGSASVGSADILPAPTGPNESGLGYPSPTDPNLHCAPDGRSWTYKTDCQEPPPPPQGLCASDYQITSACAGGGSPILDLDAGVPEGWPCPVPDQDAGPPDEDAGPAPDAGK